MTKRVLTVGCEIPGGLGEHISFQSKASLLDADFVLFCPTLPPIISQYREPVLSASDSETLQLSIRHWERELTDVLNAGNTVFVLLSDLKQLNLNTDHLLNFFDSKPKRAVTNYDVFPYPIQIVSSTGTSMKLCQDQSLLGEYWQYFGAESEYRVYLHESDQFSRLVTTRQGNKVVGAIRRAENNGGALIALPWLDLKREGVFTEECEDVDGEFEYRWTPVAKEWGNRFLNVLSSIDHAVKSRSNRTPIPQWAQSDIYKTTQEVTLSAELLLVQGQIAELERTKEDTEAKLAAAGSLKALLFEQGDALEDVVLKAMRLMGFSANRYRDSESEFDAVLECSEGRCIGEIEGRDNKAINIDKMRQLETNILEDLSRNEVSEPAKAVLFGNAFRLKPPSERPSEHFTQKCKSAAHRNGTALVRTSDLFTVAKALSDNPDEKFAAACRAAILSTNGREVEFPTLPESTAVGAINDGRNRPEKLTEGDSDTMG